MSDEIVVVRNAGVATIMLNAPRRRNAITAAMARQLIDACDSIDGDPEIGAVVVTGAGGYFCAGGERETLARAGEGPADPDNFDTMTTIYQSFRRVGDLAVPSIAAVRGGAVGAGLNLALAADLRVIGATARLVSGFLPIRLHPGGGHGALLGRAGQREAVNAMALFGESVDGSRAAQLGLAWAAPEDVDVEPHAYRLAAVPAADPELARRTLRSMRLQLGPPGLSWDAALELERSAQMWSMRRKHLG